MTWKNINKCNKSGFPSAGRCPFAPSQFICGKNTGECGKIIEFIIIGLTKNIPSLGNGRVQTYEACLFIEHVNMTLLPIQGLYYTRLNEKKNGLS